MYVSGSELGIIFYYRIFIALQLSELEQRVVEAETRAEDAEDKVRIAINYIYILLSALRVN